MKTFFTITALSFIMAFSATGCYTAQSATSPQYYQSQQYENDQEVNIDVFYNELSPYGRWVDYPNYGRVWISNERDFAPYRTGGHWVYTDLGWTWASDYAWGWAPFHYGRWIEDPFYGWAWVPGYEWAPAWVSWRRNNDYYGWAPLSPGLSINISINAIPANRWNFVPNRYITNPNVRNYYVNNNQNTYIINNTTVINNTNTYRNTRFISGPERGEAERFTGGRINAIQVNNTARPSNNIDNRGYNIYRPNVRNNNPPRQQNHNAETPKGYDIGSNRQRENYPNNLPNNNRPMRPETSQRPDGNTITTLENRRPNQGNNSNDNNGNIGDNKDGRPTNRGNWNDNRNKQPNNIQQPPKSEETRPINRGNWGDNRNVRPSNIPQQQPDNRPPTKPAIPTENRPVQQLPHTRPPQARPLTPQPVRPDVPQKREDKKPE